MKKKNLLAVGSTAICTYEIIGNDDGKNVEAYERTNSTCRKFENENLFFGCGDTRYIIVILIPCHT